MAEWNRREREEEAQHPFGDLTFDVVAGLATAEEAVKRVSAQTSSTLKKDKRTS